MGRKGSGSGFQGRRGGTCGLLLRGEKHSQLQGSAPPLPVEEKSGLSWNREGKEESSLERGVSL